MSTSNERGTVTQVRPGGFVASTLARFAQGRQLAAIAAMGAATGLLGAAAGGSAGAWVGSVAIGMAAGLLLGMLLVRPREKWLAAACSAVVVGAFAVGAFIAGAALMLAMGQAAAAVAAGLIAYGLLRRRQVEPAGLIELAPFARSAAVAIMVVPLFAVLASLLPGGAGAELAGLWRAWLAGMLGAVAALPLVLAWSQPFADPVAPRQGQVPWLERRPVLAALAWLPVPVVLAGRPELMALALLPLIAAAARLGPRVTAVLGVLTGLAIAAAGFPPTRLAGASPELVVVPACVGLLAALAIAILAAQRDRTERALAFAGEQLQAVTERGPTLMATLDTDLRHHFANRAYLHWLGKEAGQVLGRSLQDVYGDAAAAIVAPVRRALAGQAQREQIELPGGLALDAHFEPRFAPDGLVDGVHLLAQDAAWRSLHQRSLDAMLAAAADPTVVLDGSGAIARLNDKMEALLGAAPKALVGQPPAAWLEPAAVSALGMALAQVRGDRLPRQLPRALDLHARRADSGTFPVELHLAAMEAGRGVQVVVAVKDLAPRLAWEQLMADTRGQAEGALNALGDAVVACDLQERITLFNPAAVRMSGWSEDDAVGKPLAEVLPFSEPASGAPQASLLGQAMRGNAVVRQHKPRLLLRRDGETASVAESAAPIRDRFGQVSGGVLALHDVSQAQAQAQTLAHQALHDHLTGLPNRILLQDRLSQALSQVDRGYKGALLYLDLDRFKPINDRLGHPVGDRVLQEIAARLRAGVRQDDTVSRQGGDEFMLLLVRLADPRDAARVAGKLISAVEEPILIDGHELSVSASIGIALFPQDGRDTQALTRQADAALYHAKQGGRGRYSYFTDIMSASAEERMRTEHDLRIALSNGDFSLAWQPQVRLPQRHVDGVEALVRWRQHDGTVLLPEAFIPVAEETGLVVEIDEWVLREACRQNLLWQQQGMPPLPASVNISLARFDAERLLGHVRSVLDDTGLEPRWLEIEFKGAQLFAQGERGHALVAALKAMGVRVAADDFGTGTASLGALAQFDFDTLKIDRDFIENIVVDAQARAVTKVMLGIGQAMGYRVIAKGVETDAQYDALVQLGCSGMQGLMFGEAASAARFAKRHAEDAEDAKA